MSFAEATGSFTNHPTNCRDCGALIGFKPNDRKPYNVESSGSEFFRITSTIHNETCSVKVRKRLEQKCGWCHYLSGENILSFRSLIDYMKCSIHSDEKAEISYRGKSLPMNNKTLHLMLDDAMKARRHKQKMKESGVGNEAIDSFLG